MSKFPNVVGSVGLQSSGNEMSSRVYFLKSYAKPLPFTNHQLTATSVSILSIKQK